MTYSCATTVSTVIFLAVKYANAATPCEFVCWLRDPVERVLSRFFYGQREGTGHVKGMTLTDFLSSDRYHNTYAKYLWSFDIERFDFVGITEDYEMSLDVFRRRFGLIGRPGEAIAFNVNPDKDIGQTYAVSRKERKLIERSNAEDIGIYERGKHHLDRSSRAFLSGA